MEEGQGDCGVELRVGGVKGLWMGLHGEGCLMMNALFMIWYGYAGMRALRGSPARGSALERLLMGAESIEAWEFFLL